MKSKTFLIAGASGAVGEGITAELLRKGHKVLAVLRNEQKLSDLEDYLKSEEVDTASLEGLIYDFSVAHERSALPKRLTTSELDAAIASLGSWYHGKRLPEVPSEDLEQAVQGGLWAHLYLAQAVMPVLAQRSSSHYFMVNGGAAEFPVPHSGIISILAAAQKMMTRVLHQEYQDSGVQVRAVAAFDMVRTRRSTHPDQLWLGAEEITQHILQLMEKGPKDEYWFPLQKPEDLQQYA